MLHGGASTAACISCRPTWLEGQWDQRSCRQGDHDSTASDQHRGDAERNCIFFGVSSQQAILDRPESTLQGWEPHWRRNSRFTAIIVATEPHQHSPANQHAGRGLHITSSGELRELHHPEAAGNPPGLHWGHHDTIGARSGWPGSPNGGAGAKGQHGGMRCRRAVTN